MSESAQRLLSPKEFRQLLGISDDTERRWRAAGLIRYMRINRVVRYSLADVDALIKKFCIEPKRKKSP